MVLAHSWNELKCNVTEVDRLVFRYLFSYGSVDGATDESVEDDAGNDEVCSSPSVQTQQPRHQRREHERTDTRATDGDASRQGSTLVEVVTDHDDRRQIHQTKSHAFINTSSSTRYCYNVNALYVHCTVV